MKNKIKGLLALALAAFTSLTWAAELVIPYTFDGKTGNTEYAYEYQVKMPSEALTSFTTTIRYAGGSHRVEILGVKLLDGETEYTAVATGTEGTEVVDAGSYSGGNSYHNIFTFTNEAGFTANKVYTLRAMLKVTNANPSHRGNIKVSGGITLYVPPYSFGVNFTTGSNQNISTTEGAGFAKGTYAKPINWSNFQGSASGNGTMTIDNQTLKVYWTSRGTYYSDADTSTDDGKLLKGYLDDTVNNGRTKATVTITGLPSDKQYAVALILSGDASGTGFNTKYSPALINGEIYSYADGALVTGDAAVAATTWGNRCQPGAGGPTTPIEGQNVMFVEGLSGSILTITSAMDAQNTSRLTIAGVQVWTTEDTPVAPTAPEDKEVVSLNFYSSQGSVSGAAGLVSAQGWENLAASGTETTLAVWNGATATDLPLTLTYSSENGYQYTADVTDNYIKGYLDDGGNQAQVTVENIPFEEYSVIVYAATDTENKKFKPFLINGSYYTGVATPTAYGYADLVLEGEQNLRSWGGSRNAVAAYGKNALRVDGLTDSTLTIKGGSNGDGARGGIAAMQIINTGAALPDEQVIDWRAQPADQVKVSALPALTNPFVKLKLADGVTLVVDTEIAGHFIEIVGNNVTVNITTLELGKAEVEAIVSGAASVTTSYTETLGIEVDGINHPYFFRGTTDATYNNAANWYIGKRVMDGQTKWLSVSGDKAPGMPNSAMWQHILLDGAMMDTITSGEDGYRTITSTSNLEGWNARYTVINGAKLVISGLQKIQNGDGANAEWRVDETSKITFNGTLSTGHRVDFYVKSENGVTASNLTLNGSTNYELDSAGSVVVGTLNGTATINDVELDLGDSTLTGRKVVSRKLIGFTAGNATFIVADDAVTTTAEDVTLETAEILQNVGQYKFEQKNDGYYVSYVAYAETDEIGAMNTWTAKVDGNWNTAGNWSSGFVPASGKNATISITADTTITIPDEVTVDNLTVTGDGTLTIAGGKLTATKIYANANIAAGETTLALAPMNIAEGKTVTYTTTTTMADPDSMGNVNHALSLKAMTGAGTFVKKDSGIIGLFATAAEPAIVIEEGAIYVRETPTTAMNIAAKAGAEIRLAAWHHNFANTANEITLDGGAQLTLANGANVSGTITIANAAETAAKICGSSFNASTIAAAITGTGKVEFADGGAFGEGKYPCQNATTYSGVISGELQVIISDPSAVTFTGANTYTGGTVIAEGVTLNAGTGSLGTGAVTGAGKLVVAGYPSNATVRNSLGAAEWTGRYVNTADNTMADTGNWFGAVGNENSEVEFSGASTGYLAAGGSSNFDLIVSGSITFSNGNSGGNNGYTFNGALLGEGTLATLNNQTDVLQFLGETKDFAGTITVAGGHCIAFGEQADDGTAEGKLVVSASKTANIAAGKTWTAVNGIEVAGTIGGEGTIGSTLILLNGATLANALTLEGNVTVAEGVDINHAYATAAGDTVITCANAEAVASALTGAPQGLKYVAEGGAVKLAVATVNVTIPAAPANTKWFMGETEVSGTIAVDPNTDVTLTLKAEEGYVFADGSTSKDYTVNSGENGATVETPEVTAATPVAIVNGTKYQTLQAAVNAANAGATVTVIADIVTDGPITVNKKVTVNLGGKTIAATNDKEGNGVFYVVAGGDLTLEGDGTVNAFGSNDWCMAIWARDGGKVTINGGTYTNVGATSEEDGAHFDLIYVRNGGSVEINGGTFICQTPRWTLNSRNDEPGTFVVNGGTFKDFNPAAVNTDDNVTTWCAEGYTATLGEDGYWTVAAIPVSNNVAMIGETEYPTLDLAFENVKDNETIVLLKDITANLEFPSAKTVTLDLNGKELIGYHTIVGSSDTITKWTIQNGKMLNSSTANNAIKVSCATVVFNNVDFTTYYHGVRLEDYGKGIVNSGTYKIVVAGAGVNLLYAKSPNSELTVNGGTFEYEIPENAIRDYAYAVQATGGETSRVVVNAGLFKFTTPIQGAPVVVQGGTFKKAPTNYIDSSRYDVVDSTTVSGYYTVVEKPAIEPSGSIEVSATDAAAAAAKVEILIPEGVTDVDAATYATYFTKTATFNESTGKYTVTAALNPAVVTPEITAISFDENGNVTVALETELPGLYYAVRSASEVGKVDSAEATVTPDLKAPATGDAAFYRVLVDFAPIAATPAE